MPSALETLQNLRRRIEDKQFSEAQMRTLVVSDVDGRVVRLRDPDILAVVDRRINEEISRTDAQQQIP